MPKILILASISKAFYNFSFEFLETLIERRWEVVLSIPEDPLNAEFEKIGCRVSPAPLKRHGLNPLAELKLCAYYRKLFREVRPDVMMSFTIKPNTYGGWMAQHCGVPYCASVTGLGQVFHNGGAVNYVIRQMLKQGLRKAETVFFQNQENAQEFKQRKMLRSPIVFIPGSGVNLERRPLLAYPPEDGKIRFLMEARASREKGVREYLEAAHLLRQKHPECEFHFAGFTEEKEYETLLRQAADSGDVIYHGFLKNPEVEALMRTIHAVVLPSYHEGLSNVLLEGAAYGRPLLTGDVAGCRETVIPEKSGLLFEVQSSASLAAALERFIALPYPVKQTMGEAGRKHVAARFDRKLTVNIYLGELEKIVRKK